MPLASGLVYMKCVWKRNIDSKALYGKTGLGRTLTYDIDEKQSDDPNVLVHIQIKYVNTFEDVVRYLAYAPSLPNHMQPLDGIILLGVGELLSRQSNSSNMELTHLCEWYNNVSF